MSLFRSRALGRWAPSPVPWPDSACWGSPCWSAMELFSRIPALALVQVGKDLLDGKLRGSDAGRDADAVVGRSTDSQAWHRGDPGPDGCDSAQMADRVLGQPAAPSCDARVRRVTGHS